MRAHGVAIKAAILDGSMPPTILIMPGARELKINRFICAAVREKFDMVHFKKSS